MDEIKYKLETAKDGNPTIIAIKEGKEFPLHSRISPIKESASADYSIVPEKFDLIIFIGCGLGYSLIPLKTEINKFKKVIIIDDNKELKKFISQNPHTDFLVKQKNVIFLEGLKISEINNKIIPMIDFDAIKGISVIEHPQSFRIFPEYYSEIKSIINKIINKKASDAASINAFGKLYLINALKNIPLLKNYSNISRLFRQFENFPAVVIASGPSLDSNISFLRNIQDKIFIIAADSAGGPLAQNGIIPDFVISVDPQPYIEEHLRLIPENNSAYIFSITANAQSVKKHNGFITMTSHPVCQFIEELSGSVSQSIDSLTGNVSGDALIFAYRAGYRNIGLMGLDFSFSDYSIYAKGSAYQNRFSLFFQNRIIPVETANLNYIMKSSGGTVCEGKLTRKSFINYRNSFEEMIKKNNISGVYNINNSGLDIKGTERISIKNFADRFCLKTIPKNDMISALKKKSPALNGIINLFKKNITDEIFTEIISASLGKIPDNHRSAKFRKMLRSIK